MPHDYESAYKEAYKVNTDDTPRAVKDGELDVKIDNFCELHGFDRDAVAKEIRENRILSALFAKDPAKQKFHEKEAARLIEAIDCVENFADLHNSKLYLVGGAVLDKTVIKSGAYPNAKTIDFEWVYRGCQFYASHKYTKSSGGSQGSAYKDLQMFITEANLTTLQQTFFIAIADGGFYQNLNGKANTTRIQRLKDMANKSKVFACEITELESLTRIIHQLDGLMDFCRYLDFRELKTTRLRLRTADSPAKTASERISCRSQAICANCARTPPSA